MSFIRLGGGAATLGILGGGGFGVRGDVICGGGVGCAVALGDGAPAEFFSGVFCFGGIIIGMPIIIAEILVSASRFVQGRRTYAFHQEHLRHYFLCPLLRSVVTYRLFGSFLVHLS